jgi:hypothetical protein
MGGHFFCRWPQSTANAPPRRSIEAQDQAQDTLRAFPEEFFRSLFSPYIIGLYATRALASEQCLRQRATSASN